MSNLTTRNQVSVRCFKFIQNYFYSFARGLLNLKNNNTECLLFFYHFHLSYKITINYQLITMKYRLLLIFSIVILCLNLFTLPSLSQTLTSCEQNQEIFAFQVPNYAIQHQGGAILNLKVAYRLTPDAIAQNDYPDLIPIRKDIDNFLVNYPNEKDYWEIINKKLVKFTLNKYPQISSLKIEMSVFPTPNEPFTRASIVTITKPQNCAIINN